MYPDKQAGTTTQATQVVDISIWKYKIIKTNIDLKYRTIGTYYNGPDLFYSSIFQPTEMGLERASIIIGSFSRPM